jgi:DNA-directed RNA polymerase I and III subunit RPAC1
VLSHRLGLIPLTGNTEGLQSLQWYIKPKEGEEKSPNDFNTIVLKLNVECTAKEGVDERTTSDPNKLFNHAHVYARDLVFEPVGRQPQYFTGEENVVRAVNPDVLIAKLRPPQAISLIIHCVKGIGADHAKFSPVATATYRLLPTITITRPILGADAKKFARCFPRGVIAFETVTDLEANREGSGYEGHEGEEKAVVADPFKDTVSRECLRHPEFADKVKLGRVRDHFIFSIESTGQFKSDLLFLESVKVLKYKCLKLRKDLANLARY